MKVLHHLLLALLCAGLLPGQNPAAPGQTQLPAAGSQAESSSVRPTYVLGPGDQITIRASNAEEISERPYRVDTEGLVNLPLLGRVPVAGLTLEQLEADLVERLRKFVRNPQVSVSVVQFRSEPVFFVGAFKAPGIYPLQGRRNLVEMLTAIGGLQPNASRRIKLTRRAEVGEIPLPNTIQDPNGKGSSVEISIGSLRENVNPAEDIVLMPFDVISVERAEMVYMSGEVGRVGGIELGERDYITVTQALAMSGGTSRQANLRKARILRPMLNSAKRAQIPVDLVQVIKGEANDFPLMPNDVLYVPRTNKRAILTGTAFYAVGLIPALLWLF